MPTRRRNAKIRNPATFLARMWKKKNSLANKLAVLRVTERAAFLDAQNLNTKVKNRAELCRYHGIRWIKISDDLDHVTDQLMWLEEDIEAERAM
jgi:predicted transcriptional regulator